MVKQASQTVVVAPRRSKVKSGCRTCKTRKVKCDEERPACNRCVSTGRKCEGYGIWGGGASAHIHHTAGRIGIRSNPFPLFVNASGEEEHCSFEWFRTCASKRIPGPFQSMFWDRIVLAACFDEPAVLHAALALGFAHKAETIRGNWSGPISEAPDPEEQFVLKQYSKAIRQLQPHLAAQSVPSVRIALISCMIFVCLEYLRGRYRTGNQHLCNGIWMMGDLAKRADPINLETLQDPSDRWLLETFSKLNMQANLIGQGTVLNYNCVQTFDSLPSPVLFESMDEARCRLDWLQSDILRLTDTWEEQRVRLSLEQPDAEFLKRQSRILNHLEIWERVFTMSRVSIVTQMGHLGEIVFRMLRMYHSMALIMGSVAFRPDGETTYDKYSPQFKQVVEHGFGMAITFATIVKKIPSYAQEHKGMPFTSTKGCIPPLYFAATKCRVPKIRRQAIKFLTDIAGREGIWDGPIAGTVASEVLRLEEGDFYDDLALGDSIDIGTTKDEDLIVPALPESQRMDHVKVTLPNGRLDFTVITLKRSKPDKPQEIIIRSYDPTSRTWTNVSGT